LEPFDVEKFNKSLALKAKGLDSKHVNLSLITEKVTKGIYSGVKVSEIVNLTSETCAYLTIVHPDFSILANRVSVTALHKMTHDDIRKVADSLYTYKDKCNNPAPLLSTEVYDVFQKYGDQINARLDYTRDFNYDFFGFKTLERSYLLKVEGEIVERPQHMLMRCSIGIHLLDLESAFETYDLMSQMWFTHATPTLFNSGTPKC